MTRVFPIEGGVKLVNWLGAAWIGHVLWLIVWARLNLLFQMMMSEIKSPSRTLTAIIVNIIRFMLVSAEQRPNVSGCGRGIIIHSRE